MNSPEATTATTPATKVHPTCCRSECAADAGKADTCAGLVAVVDDVLDVLAAGVAAGAGTLVIPGAVVADGNVVSALRLAKLDCASLDAVA